MLWDYMGLQLGLRHRQGICVSMGGFGSCMELTGVCVAWLRAVGERGFHACFVGLVAVERVIVESKWLGVTFACATSTVHTHVGCCKR